MHKMAIFHLITDNSQILHIHDIRLESSQDLILLGCLFNFVNGQFILNLEYDSVYRYFAIIIQEEY